MNNIEISKLEFDYFYRPWAKQNHDSSISVEEVSFNVVKVLGTKQHLNSYIQFLKSYSDYYKDRKEL